MTKYSIFSICTKNYRDAYNFVIDSWLKNTQAEKIYIYTDDETWISDNNRIEIILFLNKEENWNKVVKSKTNVFEDFHKKGISWSVFLDIDCYVKEDIGNIFKKEFDFGVTRLNTQKLAVSTGVVFIKYNDKMIKFYTEWKVEENKIEKRRNPQERTCSNNQHVFSLLVRKKHKIKELTIHDVDVDIYNRKAKPNRVADLIKQEKKGKKIKVLHFYNNSYRDKDYVKELKDNGLL